jgi:serine/threonine protein kinase
MLGRGGSSEVWLANDQLSGLQVALKVYAPGMGLDEDGVRIFSTEFKLVFNLKHPHLLCPTHYDIRERMPYLVMPYIERGSTMKRIGEFTEKEAWRFLHDVASGLAYLHGRIPPVIHQDIKPDNVLMGEDGVFLITDFGISTKMRTTLPNNPATAGSMTMAYAAPERWSKKNRPTMASDIWALGASIFELLTGYAPYGELGGGLQFNGAEIPELEGKWSRELNEIVEYCLQREPGERPTANEIVEICKSHFDKEPVSRKKKSATGKPVAKATVLITKQEENRITNPTNPPSSKKIKPAKPVSKPTVIKSNPEDIPIPPYIPTVRNPYNFGDKKILYIIVAAVILLLLTGYFVFRNTGASPEAPLNKIPNEISTATDSIIGPELENSMEIKETEAKVKPAIQEIEKPAIQETEKPATIDTSDFLDKGNKSFNEGNYAEALVYYRQAGKKVTQERLNATEKCASLQKTADAFFSQQKFEEAKKEYRKILDENQFDKQARQRVKECDEQINPNSHEQK